MRFLLSLLCVVFILSCKEDTSKPQVSQEKINLDTPITQIENPVQGKSHLPRLKAAGGKLHMTWVEQEDSVAVLKYAAYVQDKWTQPQAVTSGTDWFVNWADFPSLAVNGETIMTNILQKSSEGTYDYDVKLNMFNVLNDVTGNTLSRKRTENFLLHTDGISAEHGFVSSAAYDDGFYVSWLDGRNTKNASPEDNQMTLRNAFVNLDGVISQESEVDARVCDCCNTATAITSNGPIVVYRDRSEAKLEIRNMSIVRWVDGQWTAPQTIGNDNWQLNGCPVNGPALDTQDGNVVVSWFTAADNDPRVLTAFSMNNGEQFGAPIRLDSGDAIGRVDTQFMDDRSALVSWLEPDGDDIVLQVARVYKDGLHDEPIAVTTTSAARQSGFPQLEVLGDVVFVAWTDLDGDSSQVEMVSFELE